MQQLYKLLAAASVLAGMFLLAYPLSAQSPVCDLYIPNAFSPNSDGENDEFKAFVNCSLTDYEIQVFDRWGNVVFQSENPDLGWDGMVNGERAKQGVYIYLIRYNPPDGEGSTLRTVQSGTLTLLR